MKFTRNKVIIGLVIVLALGASFWYGGDAPGLQGWSTEPESEDVEDAGTVTNTDLGIEKETGKEEAEAEDEEAEEDEKDEEEAKEEVVKVNEGKDKEKEEDQGKEDKEKKKAEADKGIESRPGGKEGKLSASEKTKLAKEKSKGKPSKVEKGSESYSKDKGMEIDSNTGKDKYQTDPVPEGKPVPIEPENNKINKGVEKHAYLSVRADTILDNMDWLNPDKRELVPKDGVIYARKKVKFYEGESVFDLLQREMKNSKIHMEFSKTPAYNSAYIEGINNLYEFDCGELSGWMYKVNDWFPNYGVSRYALKEGDQVEFEYTCKLGEDIGGFNAIGGE